MKLNRLKLIISLFFAAWPLCAQSADRDPLAEALFPPEFVLQQAEVLNLTEQQKDTLNSEMHRAHDRFTEMHSKLQKEREAAAQLLKKERVDEPAALAQFDKVLDQERELKRAHLALVLALKNKLTPEQQTKLHEIKKQHAPTPRAGERPRQPPPASLQEKMKKLKEGVKKLDDEGGDATSVGELMQEFKPLMDEHKYKQAEELLDQALKLLRDQKR